MRLHKSQNIDLSTISISSTDSDDAGQDSPHGSFLGKNSEGTKSIKQHLESITVNLNQVEPTNISDSDFDLNTLNSPVIYTEDTRIQPVECIILMRSSFEHHPDPPTDSKGRPQPVVFQWMDISSRFDRSLDKQCDDNFTNAYKRLKVLHRKSPNARGMQNISTLRRDVPEKRILFHYIGYGFPDFDEDSNSVYVIDETNKYTSFKMSKIFENIGTPAMYVFDCSNAAAALVAFNRSMKEKAEYDPYSRRKYDWNDFFFLCATDIGESLPYSPKLPRDFFTACLLTPSRIALVCHILQYYHNTLVNERFPFNVETTKTLEKALKAIVDSIVIENLEEQLFKDLFRSDKTVSKLFRNFIIAQYLLKPFNVHPVSKPTLPDFSTHPLWAKWRSILDCFISTHGQSIPLFNFARQSFKSKLDAGIPIPTPLLAIVAKTPNPTPEVFELIARFTLQSLENRKKLHSLYLLDYFLKCLSKQIDANLLEMIFSIIQITEHLSINASIDFNPILEAFDNGLNRDKIAALIACLLSYNTDLETNCIEDTFLLKVKDILMKSDHPLTEWLLVLIRKLFDVYGVELSVFYTHSIHIEIALFALSDSPSVRAAALATIPCLLQNSEDKNNAQLMSLALPSFCDCCPLVRYSMLLLISRFFNIYQDAIIGVDVEFGNTMFFNFEPLLTGVMWRLETVTIETLIDKLSDFNESTTALSHLIGICVHLLDFLRTDPDPSIASTANHLLMSIDVTIKQGNQPQSSSVPSRIAKPKENKEERPPIAESGGDAVYRVLLRKLVEKPPKPKPFKTLTTMRIEGETPTFLKVSQENLIAVGTNKGVHLLTSPSLSIDLGRQVSCVEFFDDQFIVAGTTDGCCFMWDPNQIHPALSFRADFSTSTIDFPQFVCPLRGTKTVLTARGKSGGIRLFDLEKERIVAEWSTGAQKMITALHPHPANQNMFYVGYSHGLIQEMDTRERITNSNALKSSDPILKIASNAHSETPIYACSKKGTFLRWETMERTKDATTRRPICGFDVHPELPYTAIVADGSNVIITDLEWKEKKAIELVDSKSAVAFHPTLPYVVFASPSGNIVEIKLE